MPIDQLIEFGKRQLALALRRGSLRNPQEHGGAKGLIGPGHNPTDVLETFCLASPMATPTISPIGSERASACGTSSIAMRHPPTSLAAPCTMLRSGIHSNAAVTSATALSDSPTVRTSGRVSSAVDHSHSTNFFANALAPNDTCRVPREWRGAGPPFPLKRPRHPPYDL